MYDSDDDRGNSEGNVSILTLVCTVCPQVIGYCEMLSCSPHERPMEQWLSQETLNVIIASSLKASNFFANKKCQISFCHWLIVGWCF